MLCHRVSKTLEYNEVLRVAKQNINLLSNIIESKQSKIKYSYSYL